MPPLSPVATTAATTAAVNLGTVSLQKAKNVLASGKSLSSLADVARPARVEPIVLVDKPLEGQDYMTDVMKFALTTFAGYYLQAVSLVGMQVGRINVLKTLDSVNPRRSGALDAVWSKESYQHGLPSLEAMTPEAPPRLLVETGPVSEGQEARDSNRDGYQVSGVDNETVKQFYEVPNLAVGKLINVELRDGDQTGHIPVMIRLVPSAIPSQTLTHIFTATSKAADPKERYHLWRAGQIRLVRDLIFCTDLIDEHRKTLLNDTSSVYMTMNQRRKKNVMKAYASGTPSMADASNIAVVTKETAREIGRAMNGKIDSLKTRKAIFDTTYLLLLVVVDERWERVTIYHRGIDQPTEVSLRDIKASEKGKGPDVSEILKAYTVGASPSI